MSTGRMSKVLQQLGQTTLRGDGGDLTDAQLLERFRVGQDEAAFEALLRRHGRMVFGVCRRVLGSYHDAEDAFQATFLVLARTANAIRKSKSVASFLYGTAYRTAAKARAATIRRRRKEEAIRDLPRPEPVAVDAWQELEPLLDQELGQLPDKYREAIVLCDLNGRTRGEAARQLGVPEGTLSARLTRGRRLLAQRLAARGLTLSAAALAGALSRQAASAGAPAPLMRSTVRAACLVAAGQTAAAGMVSTRVVALTEGVMKAMLLTKLKTLLAVLLAVALLVTGGSLLTYRALAADQNGTRPADPPPAAAAAEEKAKPDKEQLRGTWIAVSGEKDGAKLSEDELKHWGQLVFNGDTVTREGRERREGTFTLDPDKKLKEIDLFTEQNTWRGLYELKGTTLKLVLKFGEERPTAFDAPGAFLLVFARKEANQEGGAPEEKKAESDKEALQGTWVAESGEKDGQKLDEFQLKNWEKFVFAGDKVTREGSEKRDMTYTLDPEKNPREIDLFTEKNTFQGIYELKGTTLKLAIKVNGRPTEFDSKGGFLVVFKKEKK